MPNKDRTVKVREWENFGERNAIKAKSAITGRRYTRGCMANAAERSPFRTRRTARVKPQPGQGTPKIKFMGHACPNSRVAPNA